MNEDNKIDRILGCIYGSIIGDVIGLQVRGFSREMIIDKFGDAFNESNNPIPGWFINDNEFITNINCNKLSDNLSQLILVMNSLSLCLHRKSFDGDNSFIIEKDTEPSNNSYSDKQRKFEIAKKHGDLIEMLNSQKNKKININERPPGPVSKLPIQNVFAWKLKKWNNHGFPEFGNKFNQKYSTFTNKVVSQSGYLRYPLKTAKNIWDDSIKQEVTNEVVMRSIIIGCLSNIKIIQYLTELICKCTHPDPRCIASCNMATYIICALINGSNVSEYSNIIMNASRNSINKLPFKMKKEFSSYPYQSLVGLRLDNCNNTNLTKSNLNNFNKHKNLVFDSTKYTYKCMGCSTWTLREIWRYMNRNDTSNIFKKIISSIILEGGDTNTNAAISGSIIGASIGYSNLPKDWIKIIPNKEWIDKKVKNFIINNTFEGDIDTNILNPVKYEEDVIDDCSDDDGFDDDELE